MPMPDGLRTELEYFNSHRDELLCNHKFKFVLIKGDKLVNAFDTAQAAYEEGVAQFKSESFLVKQVLETEPTVNIFAAYIP